MKIFNEGQYLHYSDPIVTTHSKSRIEYVKDNHFCELASQLLYSSLCGKLQRLDLDFYGENKTAHNILAQLKNLPVLTKLGLSDFEMGIHELETLHQYVPSIEELSILEVRITSSRALLVTLPANNLKILDVYLNNVEDVKTLQQLFQYMSKKYVNVKDVEYDGDVLLELAPDEIAPVYLNGLIPFLQLIAPNKREFQLKNVPDGIDIFKSLDAVGCRFEKLEFLASENTMFGQHLIQSDQYDTIQTLSLCCTVLEPPDILKTMMSLCSISIMVDQDDPTPFNLTDYLNGFPSTLKKCSIKCERYIARNGDTNISSIEELDLTCHSIGEDLLHTIEQSFPKLVKLKLSGAMLPCTIFSLKKPVKEFTLLTTRSDTHYVVYKYEAMRDHYRCNKDGSTISVTVQEIYDRDFMWIVSLNSISIYSKNFPSVLTAKFYKTFLRPILEYGLAIACCSKTNLKYLDRCQDYSLRRLFGGHPTSSTKVVKHMLNIQSTTERAHILTFKYINRATKLPSSTLLVDIIPFFTRKSSYRPHQQQWCKIRRSSPFRPLIRPPLPSYDLEPLVKLYCQIEMEKRFSTLENNVTPLLSSRIET